MSQGLRAALSSMFPPYTALVLETLMRHFLGQDPSTQNAPEYIGVSDEKLLEGQSVVTLFVLGLTSCHILPLLSLECEDCQSGTNGGSRLSPLPC